MLFGPAYKGIPLVSACAIAFAEQAEAQRAVRVQPQGSQGPRRGGAGRGALCKGRVLIVDDVITAGTAIRESVELIRAAGAVPAGVVLALDRQERGQGARSAVQEVEAEFGLSCVSILTLNDLIEAFAGYATGGVEAAQLASLRT